MWSWVSSGSAVPKVDESQNSHLTQKILCLEHQISLEKENSLEVFDRRWCRADTARVRPLIKPLSGILPWCQSWMIPALPRLGLRLVAQDRVLVQPNPDFSTQRCRRGSGRAQPHLGPVWGFELRDELTELRSEEQ